MKRWSTTPVSKYKYTAKKYFIITAAVVFAVATPLQMVRVAEADEYDERIQAIQREIDDYQARASELGKQADTYQNEVARLTLERTALQRAIDLKQAEYDQLTRAIETNEQKIVRNQGVLGDTIANMYVDNRITAVEMLASSKSIGEYVDKQTYRTSVRNQLTATIDDIRTLKKKLETQKVAVERNIADQNGRKGALVAKESEQQRLVNQYRSNQAAYQQLSSERSAQKETVQRQQQAAIEAAMRRNGSGTYSPAVPGDPNKGGYPAVYANADYYSYIPDKWGMFARQCVSYVAWKVEQKNGYMPYWGGRGNANQWPGNARSGWNTPGNKAIPTGSTPRAGSAGVISAGDYGHIVWVEKVNSNGTINVSQYNYWNAGGAGWGHYSEMYNVDPATYDTYIYF
ncbi:MAG: CHAP domain-containing protein [Candidatus Saccharimonadales bacterium]